MTTFNEELPDEQWRIPQPHPSSVKPSAVEDADADYHRLVNSVERKILVYLPNVDLVSQRV